MTWNKSLKPTVGGSSGCGLNSYMNMSLQASVLAMPLFCCLAVPLPMVAQNHVLSNLIADVSTKPKGHYPLPDVWSGVEKVTFGSGTFKGSLTNKSVRLDQMIVYRNLHQKSPSLLDWAICQSGPEGGVPGTPHEFRTTLPTDAELSAISNYAAFTNFLGKPFGLPTDKGKHLIGINYFALSASNTIESLHVAFEFNGADTNIYGVVVRRGTLQRQKEPR